MTTLARAVTEAQMQNTIREAAERAGALYYHDADSRKNDKGFPDTVIVTNGRNGTPPRVIWLEIKTLKGKLRPEQRDWLRALSLAGEDVFLVRPIATEDAISLQDAVNMIAGS